MRVTAVLLIALCAFSMVAARQEGPEGSLEAKDSESEKRAPTASTGAAEAAERTRKEREEREEEAKKKEEEEAAKLHRKPSSATGGASGMVSNDAEDEDEEKRERPAVVPYGKNLVIFNLQLEGPSQLNVVNAEKEIASAIASSFDRELGISADNVVIEAVNELIPASQREDTAALLELGADQLTTNVRVRAEVPEEHIANAVKEVKSMAGAELQAKLQQSGISAEIKLRGDPEVVDEPQGPKETGAAAGTATPLLALAAVAVAAAGQQRW